MKILQLRTRYREPADEGAVVATEANLLTRAGHEVVSYVAENLTVRILLVPGARLRMTGWSW
jgi:hypothetical protein